MNLLELLFTLFLVPSFAQHEGHVSGMPSKEQNHETCGSMMVFDKTSASCIALPMDGMPMSMWMIHGNIFAVQSFLPSPRGASKLSVPNMLMATGGRSYGNNYLDLNLMLTAGLCC